MLVLQEYNAAHKGNLRSVTMQHIDNKQKFFLKEFPFVIDILCNKEIKFSFFRDYNLLFFQDCTFMVIFIRFFCLYITFSALAYCGFLSWLKSNIMVYTYC